MIKLQYIFLFLLSTGAFAQHPGKLPEHSPDRNFRLTSTTKHTGELKLELQYWLKEKSGDSILLTSSILHDMPAPVYYWDQSSTKLIYEEQNISSEQIKIFDLTRHTVVFTTTGFIWGHSAEYFDDEDGQVLFFRQSSSAPGEFQLMRLATDTHEVKLIVSIKTSGDPYTGFPEISKMNPIDNEVILIFETQNQNKVAIETQKLNY